MAMNAPIGARVSTLTIHPSQFEQLSFDTNDDSVHKTIAKKEAKCRADYPMLAKRIDNIEAKLEGYDEWKKVLD